MNRPPATSPRTPSEVAREVFHAIFSERDLSDPSRYWNDESVDHFLALGRSVRGKDALAAFFREVFAAFPDWTLEIEQTIDDGDTRVVVQWTARATFDGAPWQGMSRPAARSPSAASTSSASTPTARSTRTRSTTTERGSPARSACCPARGRRPTVRCLPPSTSPRRPRSVCATIAAERVMLAQTQSSPARRDNPESVECATWRHAIVGPHHRPTLYCRQERVADACGGRRLSSSRALGSRERFGDRAATPRRRGRVTPTVREQSRAGPILTRRSLSLRMEAAARTVAVEVRLRSADRAARLAPCQTATCRRRSEWQPRSPGR